MKIDQVLMIGDFQIRFKNRIFDLNSLIDIRKSNDRAVKTQPFFMKALRQ